ncbi:MAG: MFS transporter [Burkholderiaceae bacterium]|nr:MFS transporter [Burkholderiaceae bacterium]
MTSPTSLWRNRNYMLLWSGQVVSTLGSSASQIVYPLLILALTSSPAAAGIAASVRALPYLLFSLPVGALVDRWNRRRVMIWADVGRALAVASLPAALAFHALSLAQIYAVCFVEGTLFVFFNLAEVATLSKVVPVAQFPQATAQNEAAFGAANILGPSLGAALFQAIGRGAPFVANAISFVASAASVALLRGDLQPAEQAPRRKLSVEITEGLRWMWNAPLVRTMAFLTGGLNLVGAATPLIVIVIGKHLGATAAQIGVIFSIEAVGGVIGSIIGGTIQRRFSFPQVILSAVWINAALFALYGAASNVLVLGLIASLICTVGPIYNVVQFSYRLALIPNELQGRVNSAFRLLAFGFNPIGAALSGWLLEYAGTGAAVAAFTLCCLGLALVANLNRHVRQARSFKQLASVPEPD